MGLFFFQIFFCQLDVIVAVVFVVIVEVVLSSSNIKHNEVIYIWCHFFCVIARGERERERFYTTLFRPWKNFATLRLDSTRRQPAHFLLCSMYVIVL